MNFSRDYLFQKGLPDSAISNKIVDTSRWSIIHEIIFEDNGKFYRASYRVGATECQDESAWDNDKEVECEEVRLVEKTVKVWEAVGKE